MNKLKFKPENHEYSLAGEILPSVSTVLNQIYPFPDIPNSEFYMSKGKYIHKACEMLFCNTLDTEKLDPEIFPYVNSFDKYLEDTGLRSSTAIWERPNYHKVHKYGFTPDVYFPEEQMVIDLKTGHYLRGRYKMQLTAYAFGLMSWGFPVCLIKTIQLREDGYMTYGHKVDRHEFRMFITVLKKMRGEKI